MFWNKQDATEPPPPAPKAPPAGDPIFVDVPGYAVVIDARRISHVSNVVKAGAWKVLIHIDGSDDMVLEADDKKDSERTVSAIRTALDEAVAARARRQDALVDAIKALTERLSPDLIDVMWGRR